MVTLLYKAHTRVLFREICNELQCAGQTFGIGRIHCSNIYPIGILEARQRELGI